MFRTPNEPSVLCPTVCGGKPGWFGGVAFAVMYMIALDQMRAWRRCCGQAT